MKLKPIILNSSIVPFDDLLSSKHEIFKNHSKITDLLPAIVYYAWYGRNAWNWTWIEKYEKFGFFTDLNECKEWIERRRVQGSVWHITQLPSLCIAIANKKYLWLCSVNEKNWWNSWIFDTDLFVSNNSSKKITSASLVKCIKDTKLLSFSSPKIDSFNKLVFNKKCLQWKAFSYGGNYKLSWIQTLKITHNYKRLKIIVNSFADKQNS
jgi:hypothetical protein